MNKLLCICIWNNFTEIFWIWNTFYSILYSIEGVVVNLCWYITGRSRSTGKEKKMNKCKSDWTMIVVLDFNKTLIVVIHQIMSSI